MTNNRISPLEKLRQEKLSLKMECSESEDRLASHWDYIRNNVGSLILHSAVRGVGRQLGLVKEEKTESEEKKRSGLVQGLIGSAIFAAPALWSFAQPMVMGVFMNKIKGIFTKKKKKKK